MWEDELSRKSRLGGMHNCSPEKIGHRGSLECAAALLKRGYQIAVTV
jgi:hypothetical protein